MSAERNDQRICKAHLSGCWYANKERPMFPVWTMKVAAALHTVEQLSRPGCLLTEVKPVEKTIERSDLQT